ncbi:MAG TPA: class I SAM-dependent methyltransferase [Solirubrobacteraceae bacterium]|jgi:SAM-dependent methyltransferase
MTSAGESQGRSPYEDFAAEYARENESNVWNALYERPAALALLGDVAGLRVLDAGCGAGAHAAALLERGALVTAVDASPAMVALASERVRDDARVTQADLAEPLPFENGSFDAVLCSLVLHYLRDWGPVLGELHRVLVPGGLFVMSTHHPFMDHELAGGEDYFATYEIFEQWVKAGETMSVRFWHRPLGAMTDALKGAGFVLERLEEPAPDPSVREIDPDAWRRLTSEPRFIFFVARAA